LSVIIPLASVRRTLPVIDTTFVVKLEDSQNTEPNKSYQVDVAPVKTIPTTEVASTPIESMLTTEVAATPIESMPTTEVASTPIESMPTTQVAATPIESIPTTQVEGTPIESIPTTQVEGTPIESIPITQVEATPIESIPTTEVEATPSYSQPKLPARLYFSPTLLQDDEEPEIIQPVLSTIDQNKTNIEKRKMISRQFGQTYLLDNIKNEEINRTQDIENLRPKISDEIPFLIHCDPTLLMEKQSLYESHHSEFLDQPKSVVYAKQRRRAAAAPTTKIESEPIHMTRRATRNQQPTKEIETTKRQPRKRKQSVSDDGNNNTVALRKKKTVPPPPAKTKTRKTRAKKPKEVPIREPSPLPIIDRSKHYSTRFSTRSHRFNNLTLSTTALIDDNNNNNNKSKYASTRHRTKSVARSRNHDDNEDDLIISTIRSKQNKTQPKQRAKSMMATRNRRK